MVKTTYRAYLKEKKIQELKRRLEGFVETDLLYEQINPAINSILQAAQQNVKFL